MSYVIGGNSYRPARAPGCGFCVPVPALLARIFMKNIEKIARHIAKNGPDGILVHTIPGTHNWIVCQKLGKDKWELTLCNPMGDVSYNLGFVNEQQHLNLWNRLLVLEVDGKTSQIRMAGELKKGLSVK